MRGFRPPAGFALPTLMVMLSVASLAALLAMRSLWVNDQLLNAEADQLRTRQHAQAILPIAVQDIVGNPRQTPREDTQSRVFFPATLADYDTLRQRLGVDTCRAGICAPSSVGEDSTKASFWKTQTTWAIPVSAADTPYGENTAWYWVEIFPRDSNTLFVYRITVLASGVMPSSSTVLQALWSRSTPTATTGQWHSAYVLHD